MQLSIFEIVNATFMWLVFDNKNIFLPHIKIHKAYGMMTLNISKLVSSIANVATGCWYHQVDHNFNGVLITVV